MAGTYVLALDQGTTSTRAIVFDNAGLPVAKASVPLRQFYPEAGFVEHDAAEIAAASIDVMRQVAADIDRAEIAALGITNQRETAVIWDRKTGQPIHNALVWQDRRGADMCAKLKADGHEDDISRKTGLLLDPYFSATKIAWMLDQVPGARKRAEAGDLAFGTIDCWMLWHLTGGATHATDATNASRTSLFNIHDGMWDEDLLALFDIPGSILPQVTDCQDDYGRMRTDILGKDVPISGVAGDQQAASFGQACFDPGDIKATFGTGCFVLINTGNNAVASQNRLLTTIGSQLGGSRDYALEGSIFMAGATIQWLRDQLGLLTASAESEELAKSADPRSGVYLVPAFQGLGAPHWDARARGAIVGLTRAAGRAEIVRAGLEAIAYQTCDLLSAATTDFNAARLDPPTRLRVDGGMVANSWFMQFLADMTGLPVDRAAIAETTARGAAFHAGLKAGVWTGRRDIEAMWQADAVFEPAFSDDERAARLAGWQEAVARVASNLA